MRVGSLFAGIGGLDLGLERAGMSVRWQVEIDDYCNRVLEKHWPDVKRYRDITTLSGVMLEPVDLICGGFPCQPVSVAGKRKGDQDERWLWDDFIRIVREVGPRWVVAENVPGLLSADDGRLFGGILRDLAESGFDAEWDCIPAAAVGAPHLRYRVFIVGHARSSGLPRDNGRWAGSVFADGREDVADTTGPNHSQQDRQDNPGWPAVEGRNTTVRAKPTGCREDVPDPFIKHDDNGRHGTGAVCGERSPPAELSGCQDAANRPGTGLAFGQDGEGLRELAALVGVGQWTTEPDVGRVAYGVPSRVDRLRCLGNAVVPQVAEWIGRGIMAAESGTSSLRATEGSPL